jgi:hypothetical protein
LNCSTLHWTIWRTLRRTVGATPSLPRVSQVMSSTTGQTRYNREPHRAFTDCSTPCARQYETTPSLPRGSQAMLIITKQSRYNLRPFSPFVDYPATQVEPSRYVYAEQGAAYNTQFSTHLNSTTFPHLRHIKATTCHRLCIRLNMFHPLGSQGDSPQ